MLINYAIDSSPFLKLMSLTNKLNVLMQFKKATKHSEIDAFNNKLR